jgi:hypothetical protein
MENETWINSPPNYNKGYQLQAPYFPKFPMGLVSLMDQGASISRSHPLPLYSTQAITKESPPKMNKNILINQTLLTFLK